MTTEQIQEEIPHIGYVKPTNRIEKCILPTLWQRIEQTQFITVLVLGNPGTGKTTLVSHIAKYFHYKNFKIKYMNGPNTTVFRQIVNQSRGDTCFIADDITNLLSGSNVHALLANNAVTRLRHILSTDTNVEAKVVMILVAHYITTLPPMLRTFSNVILGTELSNEYLDYLRPFLGDDTQANLKWYMSKWNDLMRQPQIALPYGESHARIHTEPLTKTDHRLALCMKLFAEKAYSIGFTKADFNMQQHLAYDRNQEEERKEALKYDEKDMAIAFERGARMPYRIIEEKLKCGSPRVSKVSDMLKKLGYTFEETGIDKSDLAIAFWRARGETYTEIQNRLDVRRERIANVVTTLKAMGFDTGE